MQEKEDTIMLADCAGDESSATSRQKRHFDGSSVGEASFQRPDFPALLTDASIAVVLRFTDIAALCGTRSEARACHR